MFSKCCVLYCIVLCCIVLHCIALRCIVLYCVVLFCIVLHCVVLYCNVLYCIYCIYSDGGNNSESYGQCLAYCTIFKELYGTHECRFA